MDEYYDPKKEYIKKLETLASYDPDGRAHAEARAWIEDYKERESWNNMGGSQISLSLCNLVVISKYKQKQL